MRDLGKDPEYPIIEVKAADGRILNLREWFLSYNFPTLKAVDKNINLYSKNFETSLWKAVNRTWYSTSNYENENKKEYFFMANYMYYLSLLENEIKAFLYDYQSANIRDKKKVINKFMTRDRSLDIYGPMNFFKYLLTPNAKNLTKIKINKNNEPNTQRKNKGNYNLISDEIRYDYIGLLILDKSDKIGLKKAHSYFIYYLLWKYKDSLLPIFYSKGAPETTLRNRLKSFKRETLKEIVNIRDVAKIIDPNTQDLYLDFMSWYNNKYLQSKNKRGPFGYGDILKLEVKANKLEEAANKL